MSGASVLYDIFMSPVKLESLGLVVPHRYAVMGDFRGGKKAPLNPAGVAMLSRIHGNDGVMEVNWALRTRFEHPFQFPFTSSKTRKEFQISVLDGGPPTNSKASPQNSKTVGEAVLNVGDYCNVIEGECCHRLIEVSFKIQGKPAILSLQLLMIPNGIPPDSVEPPNDLVERAHGGSAVPAGAASAYFSGGKALRRTTGGASRGAPATSTTVAAAGPSISLPNGTRANSRLLSVEILSELITMGAIDSSVWEASGGNPIEVDADVASELMLNLERYRLAEEMRARVGATSAAVANGSNAPVSNYEAQTGPIGSSVFAVRTQRNTHDKLSSAAMAKSLRARLAEGRAHAKSLAPSNNKVYTVDMAREFLPSSSHTGSSSSPKTITGDSAAEKILTDELTTLDTIMKRLETEQARRDVTADVCYILERRSAIEEELTKLRKQNSQQETAQQRQYAPSGGVQGDVPLDDNARAQLIQELVATERAVELLEWRKRARNQLKKDFIEGVKDPSEAFAAVQTTLELPIPLAFGHLPKRVAASTQPSQASPSPSSSGLPHSSAASPAAAATAQKGTIPSTAQVVTGAAVGGVATSAIDDFFFGGGASAAEASSAVGGGANASGSRPTTTATHPSASAAAASGSLGKMMTEAPRRSLAGADDFFTGGGIGGVGGANPPTTASPPPPAPPAPSQWHQGKPPAWGVDPSPPSSSAATSVPQANNPPSTLLPTATPIPTPAPAPAPAASDHSQSTSLHNSTTSHSYQQQYQGLGGGEGGQRATAAAATVASSSSLSTPLPAGVASASASASLSSAPMRATLGTPNVRHQTPHGAPSTTIIPTPQLQQQPQPQGRGGGGAPTTASPPPPPTASSAGPSSLSKADVLACSYVGNLLSPPIARVSFDTMQHLIVQKDAGNIQILAAGGGGSGGMRRNGLIVRFAGGAVPASGDLASGPVARGISGQLASLQWHVETDDFFTPEPIDTVSVVLSISNGKSEEFGMKLQPLPSAATAATPPSSSSNFVYQLDRASIEEMKPFCCGSASGEERAIMVWPSGAGGGGAGKGLTLVFVATFTNNGGVAVRRTVPIRF